MNVTQAITVRPPWSQIIAETAALTALGVDPKTVENRGRPAANHHIGTDIAIHAGLTWCLVGANDPRVRRAWKMFGTSINLREPNPVLAAIGDTRTGYVGGLRDPGLWIEVGAVVAIATLVDCHLADMPINSDVTCCAPWGDRYYNGQPAWHLVLDNVRRLRKSVPAKGRLSVPWTLPEDVAEQVAAQLEAVTHG